MWYPGLRHRHLLERLLQQPYLIVAYRQIQLYHAVQQPIPAELRDLLPLPQQLRRLDYLVLAHLLLHLQYHLLDLGGNRLLGEVQVVAGWVVRGLFEEDDGGWWEEGQQVAGGGGGGGGGAGVGGGGLVFG
jgi:hypothetical protein